MTGTDLITAIIGLVARNKRRYGGYIVHFGMVTMFAAFAGMAFQRQGEATLKPGESAELKSPFGHTYRFTHLGISQYEALNRVVSAATVEVTGYMLAVGIAWAVSSLGDDGRHHADSDLVAPGRRR